ncbi:MAG: VOC family protein [Proteobacteria bacterium]|nr:VOC family protein [Pseudomonadota bacterium]MBI3495740.1 VOC family protein [Pseudomonadota bacterium]
MLGIGGLDHVNIRTRDLERSQRFYQDVLGMRLGPRPAFTFPGAWLYVGDQPVVHLVGDPKAPQGSKAAFDHVAFAASGMATFKRRLEKAAIGFESRIVPGARRYQIFLTDPDGVKVELQFDAAREARLKAKTPQRRAPGAKSTSKRRPVGALRRNGAPAHR